METRELCQSVAKKLEEYQKCVEDKKRKGICKIKVMENVQRKEKCYLTLILLMWRIW